MDPSAKFFQNKDILVTGGCGSIGSEIVKQLLKYPVKRVRVLDRNEASQFYLWQKLGGNGKISKLLGDITNKERVGEVIKGVDIVFHCAALKHVAVCELNPFEAVATNVIGTQNLINAARENGVKRFISISTDKAVNPISTMGATKLLSEKLIQNASAGDCQTIFSCARFGNVLDSDASVIPIFRQQISQGGPLTITSSQMARFFMSIPQAINLVLTIAKVMKGREIFILKMGAMKITDLAEVMIEDLSKHFGHDPKKIKIKIIGVRPGEKIYESLLTEEEAQDVDEQKDMFILRPRTSISHYGEIADTAPRLPVIGSYNSKYAHLLSKNQIRAIVKGSWLQNYSVAKF
ncbi:MAG: SDR family NAD(P)-dependent oxidoreductase [Patescibacteria group bacterium]